MSETLNRFVRIWKDRRDYFKSRYHGVLITGPTKTWRCDGEMKLYGCENCSPSPFYCTYKMCGGRTDIEGTYCSSGCEGEDNKDLYVYNRRYRW